MIIIWCAIIISDIFLLAWIYSLSCEIKLVRDRLDHFKNLRQEWSEVKASLIKYMIDIKTEE